MPYRARVFGLKILLYKPLFFPQSKLVLASNNALVSKDTTFPIEGNLNT